MIQPSYIQKEIDISRLSAFKTPATTKYFFELYEETISLLPEVYDFIEQEKLPIIIVAGGTNCLFAFERWEGIVIKIANKGYSREGNILTLSGAEMSSALSSELYKKYGISTMVPWVGLPGTIAGAVIGNAGCFGLETSDICTEVLVFDQETRDFHTLSRKEIGFSYRESHLKWQTRYIVISAKFDLSRRPDTAWNTITPEELLQIRRAKQPPGLSCGSYFKNPSGYSAGRLIDEAGMKWAIQGGMKISEQHGNFFINTGGATYQDVLALAERAKSTVQSKFSVPLEEEVRIIRNTV